MFVGAVLAIVCAAILWFVLALLGEFQDKKRLVQIIFGGYLLRLAIQFFIRDVQFFSHAIGGDSIQYEEYGQLMAKLWRSTGITYIISDYGFNIGATSLPQNLFAFIIYLNGGDRTRLGCTAVVALAAALTALNIYLLAVQFGAERRNALLMASIIYFQPAFLFYTSDLYKDGLVLCIAFGALGSALRLSFRLSVLHVAIGAVSVFLLWYVRFYLIFLTVAPLIVGIAGIGSKRITRPLLAALLLGALGMALAGFTDILQLATERAAATFDQATSVRSIMGNAKEETGSGVIFDDGGSPFRALPAKIAYTIGSPFPWAGGSLGFHLGKIDGFLWYFIMYRAARAWKQADRRLLLMMLTFALPCVIMYSMTMANVGLIVRQRLVIVAATAILASLYSPQKSKTVVDTPEKAKPLRSRPPPRRAAA